jgi:hypothetical protein
LPWQQDAGLPAPVAEIRVRGGPQRGRQVLECGPGRRPVTGRQLSPAGGDEDEPDLNAGGPGLHADPCLQVQWAGRQDPDQHQLDDVDDGRYLCRGEPVRHFVGVHGDGRGEQPGGPLPDRVGQPGLRQQERPGPVDEPAQRAGRGVQLPQRRRQPLSQFWSCRPGQHLQVEAGGGQFLDRAVVQEVDQLMALAPAQPADRAQQSPRSRPGRGARSRNGSGGRDWPGARADSRGLAGRRLPRDLLQRAHGIE